MKIALIRHGRPDLPSPATLGWREYSQWLQVYERAGVVRESIPEETLEVVGGIGCSLASDLPRAGMTAELLGLRPQVAEVFREAPLGPLCLGGVRLSPGVWTVLSRLAWWVWPGEVESWQAVKARALLATALLEEKAREHGSVALIGHGFLNTLIGAELHRREWQGPARPRREHWSATVYERFR